MTDVLNLDALLQRLNRMQLTSAQQTHLHRRIGRAVMRANAAKIRDGLSPEGQAWPALKPKRINGRLKPKSQRLYGLRRHLRYWQEGNDIVVSFATKSQRGLAAMTQRGSQSARTATQAARMYRAQNDGPCRPKLAKALRLAGYTRREKDHRGVSRNKQPSVKWICANLTERQAVSILKRLRGMSSKQRWIIKVPARPLLAPHHDVVMAELTHFLFPQD